MNAEETLFVTLTADPIVSATVASRIYPDIAPQGAQLPLIVYQRSDTTPAHFLHGPIVEGGSPVVMTVACWHKDRPAATALGKAVIDALLPSGTLHSSERAGYDEETEARASIVDVLIWE